VKALRGNRGLGEFGAAWKGWWRAWRGGELRLLSVSLVLAVAVVSGIAGFSERLGRALDLQSHHFLAADRVLNSTLPVPDRWLIEAQRRGLELADIASFRSMLFAGENMQLASVRAVSSAYPLLGKVVTSQVPFGETREQANGPDAGEIWLDSRLFALLQVNVGDSLYVGEANLVVTAALVKEPDGGSAMDFYGSRALMSKADLAATEVVGPGSLVSYRYLFSGPQAELDSYAQWLAPQLSDRQRWQDVRDSQPAMASVLDRAESYLLLAASLGVALAGAAIAQSARSYGQKSVDTVAIMKTLGASRARVLRYYFIQLLLTGGLASAVGLLLGSGVQAALMQSLKALFAVSLPEMSYRAPLLGVITAVLCCVVFAAPPFLRLSRISPLRVLRRDADEDDRGLVKSSLLGIAGISLLMYLFSGELVLTAVLLMSVLLLGGGTVLLVIGVIAGLRRRVGGLSGSPASRLTVASLYRRRNGNAFQVASFALALTAVLSLALLRETMINDWQTQLAEDTPNHFLINIQSDDVAALADFFERHAITHAGLYPMVRGRLRAVDGLPLTAVLGDQAKAQRFDREMNLSWADTLPSDNTILQGQWWSESQKSGGASPAGQVLPVSVESGVAQDLGLVLGSQIEFDIGGQTLVAEVASMRSLEWESMRPNFFFIFPPESLERYASSYITSFYLAAENKPQLVKLLRDFPTITLIEVDEVLSQIQSVVKQLTQAVGVVLLLVLVCSLLVCVANVQSSLASRLQENALLRTLGAGNSLLNRLLLLEFAGVGLFAGLLSSLAGSVLLAGVQYWVLEIPVVIHPLAFLYTPLASIVLLCGIAWFNCRGLLSEPPLATLRRA
jgi:putative ABC transport system permease protein